MEAFIGTVMAVSFNFAPRGWALCNGQILQVKSNMALFSLLSNAYGGDGVDTFALPDLRGRTIIGSQYSSSTSPALTVAAVAPAAKVGVDPVTLTGKATLAINIKPANLPNTALTANINTSGLRAISTLNATVKGPGATAPALNAMLCNTGSGASSGNIYYVNPSSSTPLTTIPLSDASVTTALAGTLPFNSGQIGSGTQLNVSVNTASPSTTSVMQPSIGLAYIICLVGNYPERN